MAAETHRTHEALTVGNFIDPQDEQLGERIELGPITADGILRVFGNTVESVSDVHPIKLGDEVELGLRELDAVGRDSSVVLDDEISEVHVYRMVVIYKKSRANFHASFWITVFGFLPRVQIGSFQRIPVLPLDLFHL